MTDQLPQSAVRPEAKAARASASPLDHLSRRLLVPAILALLTVVGLAMYADARELAHSIVSFDWFVMLPVLGLSLANYSLRFLRWHAFLRRLGAALPWRDSLAILLFGFTLALTPGRTGELGKGWLVRAFGGGPARRGVSAVLAERLTDGLGICCALVIVGLTSASLRWLAALGAGILAVGIAFLSSDHVSRFLLAIAERTPLVKRQAMLVDDVLQSVRGLLSPGVLLAGGLVGTFAWITEVVSCWVIVQSMAPAASLSAVVVLYTAAILIGTVSLLPAGLIATEGVMAVAIGRLGLSAAQAASATLLTRTGTLWFAVGLGVLVSPWILKRVNRYREPGNPFR